MLSVTILLFKESVNFGIFKLQMLSFSKLWLGDNGDETLMGEGCRGCWLKTYLWMVLVDGTSLWIYTVQKAAPKNTKYSRNETILKIGHHAKSIAHAKS